MSYTVKILVIRFSSIGDIVLTSPVVRCLKEQLDGEVEVHYLTKKSYKGLVEPNPNVYKVWTIDKHTNEVIPELKQEGFDYIVDLHKNIRSKQVVRALKTLAFTFDKLNVKKWLLTNFKVNKMPDVHVVDRYFDAVKALGVVNDGKGLAYYLPAEEVVDLAVLPASHQQSYVAFAIGGQHQGKKLPAAKIAEICQGINHPVVLLGGKDDINEAEEIVDKVGINVFNACGKFSLHQSASLIEQADLVITHDTGLMHIAAAFKKKIISLWGCTSPVFGMYPYLPNTDSMMIQAEHLTKRPCSKLGNKCSYGDFRCAKEIDNNAVIKVTERLMD